MNGFIAGGLVLVAGVAAYLAGVRHGRAGAVLEDEPGYLSPLTATSCDAEPSDRIQVAAARAATIGPAVVVGAKTGSESTAILLRPGKARAVAAAILNAADDLDGSERLVFMPPGPEGEAPSGVGS